ncbi:FecR family protein [Shewanella intestini]|uniref:DUF4880 domain-containing protein n=1 Tax=Shewanella intestini TaxID=2017544 RepID=A0ABS5I506_9GAMM|nr:MULTISPECIES: FecR domain-containing protein [Shewanella]MBR9728991.1 DUF4880 domain-containing protein [Shewanella intestini]MRG36943.1 DUF4880 domain-containing protein [Shewanella sp. XMDDZSB0408]
MKNILAFPSKHPFNKEVIEQEAVEWLVKLDSDIEPTDDELQALKQWMSRSPAHAQEIKSLNVFTNNLLILTELNIPLVKPEPKAPVIKRTLLSGRSWGVAASMMGFMLMLQQLLLPIAFFGEDIESSNGYYASAIGKHTSIPLQDGSTVVLNTNSRIKVDYTEGFRNIHLIQGEAHFEVAKNKQRPFRVFAGKGRVEALGTAFTVYLRKEDVEVLVTEGKVELAELNTTAQVAQSIDDTRSLDAQNQQDPALYLAIPVKQFGILEAGEGATMFVSHRSDVKASRVKVEAMDDKERQRRDSWRQGFVVFTGDTLDEVVAEISRYSPVEIEIIDPELKKIRIGGQFKIGDLESLFDTLEFNFGLNITRLKNRRIEISAKK